MATQAEVAVHLDLSRQKVSDMIGSGVLPKGDPLDLDACRIAYIRHLREIAAGRAGEGGGGLDLVQERARLAKEQADKTAMENAQRRGDLVDAVEAARAVGQMIGMARARILALPGRLATIGATDQASIKAKAKELVNEALEELARPPFAIDGAEPGARAERGGDDLAAAAEPDHEPVGRRRARAKPRGKRRAR